MRNYLSVTKTLVIKKFDRKVLHELQALKKNNLNFYSFLFPHDLVIKLPNC